MKGGDWMSKKLALTICLAFLLSSLAGCQNTAQKPLVPDQTNNNNMTMTADERQVMAEQLANIAENVEGVSRATVVVTTIGMDSNGLGNNGNMTDNNGSMTNNNRNMTNNNGVTNNGMNNSINNTNRVNNRLNNNLDNRLNNPNTNNGVLDNNVNNTQPLGTNNMGNNMTDNTGVLVMVGLTLNNTNTGRNTSTIGNMGNTNNTNNMSRMNIKKEVATRLKASDNRISQVLVTTNANLIKRINNVAQGLIRGTPVNNFRDDINDLTTQLRREQPTF